MGPREKAACAGNQTTVLTISYCHTELQNFFYYYHHHHHHPPLPVIVNSSSLLHICSYKLSWCVPPEELYLPESASTVPSHTSYSYPEVSPSVLSIYPSVLPA
jgi:hypothetical protein